MCLFKYVLMSLFMFSCHLSFAAESKEDYFTSEEPVRIICEFSAELVSEALREFADHRGGIIHSQEREIILKNCQDNGLVSLNNILEKTFIEIDNRVKNYLRIDVGFFANLESTSLDSRLVVPEWHNHIPTHLNSQRQMFLLTLCASISLATEISLDESSIPITTSNNPANCLVYFPVSRLHRTPHVQSNLDMDYRRIHFVFRIYPNLTAPVELSALFDQERNFFLNAAKIVQQTTGLYRFITFTILHYALPEEQSVNESACCCLIS